MTVSLGPGWRRDILWKEAQRTALSRSLEPKMKFHSIIVIIFIPSGLHAIKKIVALIVALHALLSWWPQCRFLLRVCACGEFVLKSSVSAGSWGLSLDGRGDGLLEGGDTHSVWLHESAISVVSRGHSRWCPAYVGSEQEHHWRTQQQCRVSSGGWPHDGLTVIVPYGLPTLGLWQDKPGCDRVWSRSRRAAWE